MFDNSLLKRHTFWNSKSARGSNGLEIHFDGNCYGKLSSWLNKSDIILLLRNNCWILIRPFCMFYDVLFDFPISHTDARGFFWISIRPQKRKDDKRFRIQGHSHTFYKETLNGSQSIRGKCFCGVSLARFFPSSYFHVFSRASWNAQISPKIR